MNKATVVLFIGKEREREEITGVVTGAEREGGGL